MKNLLSVALFFIASLCTAAGPNVPTHAAAIDAVLEETHRKHSITANDPIDDDTFVRRAHLDIIGRTPVIEETEAFDGDRAALIRQLLNSPGHTSHSYNWWADILRLKGDNSHEAAYQLWVKEAIQDNMPYDQMVRELVGAQGFIWDNGAVGYYLRDKGMPLDNMSNTVRIFLGTRLECAQCHDHPFDTWTQMDYFKMAAFTYPVNTRGYGAENQGMFKKDTSSTRSQIFAKAAGTDQLPIPRKGKSVDFANPKMAKRLDKMGMTPDQAEAATERGMKAVEEFDSMDYSRRIIIQQLYNPLADIQVGWNERSQVQLPHDYQYDDAEPKAKVAAAPMFVTADGRREIDTDLESYVEWMTSPDNPTFTKVIVNRLWKRVFGRGISEQVDEFTEHTAVDDPALLGKLEKIYVEIGYDTRAFLEILYNTEAYQRVAHREEVALGVPYYFPGPLLRRMTAEQVWDSLVAMAIEKPDTHSPQTDKQQQKIEAVHARFQAVEGIPYEDYAKNINAIVKEIATMEERETKLREEMFAAKSAEDTQRYLALRAEGKELSTRQNSLINDAFNLKGGGYGGGASKMMMQADRTKAKTKAKEQMEALIGPEPEGLDKRELKAWARAQSNEFRIYQSTVSDLARASELPSPARRGHFLRDFGQSDRETIQNANIAPSVPQALNLLNGSTVEAISNRFAVFGRRLAAVESDREKIDIIYRAILSRRPTEGELASISQHLGEAEEKDPYKALIWSLLNTQQFLFVE